MKKNLILVLILTSMLSVGLFTPPESLAYEYWYIRDSYPVYSEDYYPVYRHSNPVVRREYYDDEGYAPDGTYHEESTVVDKHSSYYSPGRNDAITRPRTTVQSWSNGPREETTQEKTTWVGADGRPHSTTVTSETTTDRWGNTYTDTHVNLRRVK